MIVGALGAFHKMRVQRFGFHGLASSRQTARRMSDTSVVAHFEILRKRTGFKQGEVGAHFSIVRDAAVEAGFTPHISQKDSKEFLLPLTHEL